MANKDYREKIEEDRQQIEVESELSRLSRSKHKAKKRKSPLISILLVTFILIPLSLLVYVKFFYEPEPLKQQVSKDYEKVQMETNVAAKKQQEKEDKEAAEKEEAKKEAAAAKVEAEKEKEKAKKEAAAKKAAEEQAKKEAQLAAAKKAEEEAARKAAEQKAAQEAVAKQQQQQQKQQQPSSKSHTVQPGDTLYSIAMKYYGDPNAVEKIRAANGLGSDSISTGRTLVLP